jgi:hypothetical protein
MHNLALQQHFTYVMCLLDISTTLIIRRKSIIYIMLSYYFAVTVSVDHNDIITVKIDI